VEWSYFRIDIFDELADSGVLNKEVVTSGDVFHDVSLDHLVLQDGDAVVDLVPASENSFFLRPRTGSQNKLEWADLGELFPARLTPICKTGNCPSGL